MMRLFLSVLIGLALAAPAVAHEGSRSQSSWRLTEEGLESLFVVEARQATLLLSAAPAGAELSTVLQIALAEGLQVSRGGAPCLMAAPPPIRANAAGRLNAGMRWVCENQTGEIAITVNVITPLSADHVHFIRIEDGAAGAEDVLTRNRLTLRFDPDAGPPGFVEALSGYFWLGVEHILLGPDHLVFLAALLLLVTRLHQVVTLTIGFTLGHSVTLALAATGQIAPPGAGVESLIGLSILFTAAEAAGLLKGRGGYLAGALLAGAAVLSIFVGGVLPWTAWAGLAVFTAAFAGWREAGGRQEAAAPALSAGFGLLHGVGFAGILLDTGLAQGRTVASLLGFNLGVEAGQLLAVAGAVTVYALITRLHARGGEALRLLALAGTASLGAFWFFGRLM
jgi:hypothetical protein